MEISFVKRRKRCTEMLTTKLKAMGYITPFMDYYPRNGYMGETDFSSDISC